MSLTWFRQDKPAVLDGLRRGVRAGEHESWIAGEQMQQQEHPDGRQEDDRNGLRETPEDEGAHAD